MNRMDRLMAIVLELQAKRTLRAEDLAETFETSKRTIYRDILALCEAGVPIMAVPGQGYSIMEGYFLPPIRFTADEGAMLLLGADLMARNFDAEYHMAAESAARKIGGALPESLRDEVNYLRENIKFIVHNAMDKPGEAERLPQIRRAIIKHQTVSFRYHARYGESRGEPPTEREADPYALIHFSGAWAMVGYCYLRKDLRMFRLSRMENLLVTPKNFTRLAQSAMQEFMQGKREPGEGGTIVVKALFDDEVAQWVQESFNFFVVAQDTTASGLLLTLRIRHENEIMQWLLGWGRHVRVLEPQLLRESLAREAQAMLEAHHNAPVEIPESLLT